MILSISRYMHYFFYERWAKMFENQIEVGLDWYLEVMRKQFPRSLLTAQSIA